MIGHCDPARGGRSRSLRSANGGEAKSGHRQPCEIFEDRVTFDVGCWKLEVGSWMFDVGCWMLEVGCWKLEVGCWKF